MVRGSAFAIIDSNSGPGVLRTQTLAQSGPNQRVEGQVPENWHPRTGTIITGVDADKATAAALINLADSRPVVVGQTQYGPKVIGVPGRRTFLKIDRGGGRSKGNSRAPAVMATQ